mmetsp:Transcript_23588/g.51758  ORF Transcript_23588/g.51758 Transcript_23588/m.51758 type:complete len:347 (-) Transcript_23588:1431-2471(-)
MSRVDSVLVMPVSALPVLAQMPLVGANKPASTSSYASGSFRNLVSAKESGFLKGVVERKLSSTDGQLWFNSTRGFAASGGQQHKTFGEEGYIAPHPGMKESIVGVKENAFEGPAYSTEYVESVKPKHLQPTKLNERLGFHVVRLMRGIFDWATRYGPNMTEAMWLRRVIFLETVAGVPGMVAGMLRHLRSLRTMEKDNGWIHTLLEEAENERMHLLTFMQLRQPGPLFRAMVILSQGLFFNLYFVAYLLYPRACHSFVGYLEEEAVKTYTHALADIDAGKLWVKRPAPPIAIKYWNLAPDANMRDLILAVRADEACHSHVNHRLAELAPTDPNPFVGESSIKHQQL